MTHDHRRGRGRDDKDRGLHTLFQALKGDDSAGTPNFESMWSAEKTGVQPNKNPSYPWMPWVAALVAAAGVMVYLTHVWEVGIETRREAITFELQREDSLLFLLKSPLAASSWVPTFEPGQADRAAGTVRGGWSL